MRAPRLSNERGIALPVAIFALVVIGALVAGTFFAGRLEHQTGQSTVYATQAAEAADAGLSEALATGNASVYEPIAQGATVDLGTFTLGGRVTASRQVTRLTQSLFLVQALGRSDDAAGNPLATRAVSALTRLNQPDIEIKAALSALGKITVTGNSEVNGFDANPDYWNTNPDISCPPLDNVAGVRYNGQVTQQGSAVIKGEPNRDNDNSMTADNILGPDASFQELKGLATLILSGNVSGLAPVVTATVPPSCDASIESNWGDPLDKDSPCFNYFPIVYHYGDLDISGSGYGQGILLVEGNLNVQGRIDFYGPVIATGGVNIRGTGTDDVKFYGGVIAQDVTLDDSKLSGNAQVNYSSCAIRRALKGSATAQPLAERGWAQMYTADLP
jgi:hypothetical protein